MNLFHCLPGMEPWEQDDRPSRSHGPVLTGVRPVTVEQWHCAKNDRFAFMEIRTPDAALECIGHDISVREHDALRRSGYSSGVLKLRQIAGRTSSCRRTGGRMNP
jgi:hypothetical protein